MNKKSNHYLNEEDLKSELILVKKTERLKTLISKNENLTQEELEEKTSLEKEDIDPNYKRTRFGEMLLLLINKILTQPKFSSYSYKDEFKSNAIEKVFLYGIHNFNPGKISKVNGKPVKAFAYLTQIITNSIIATINEKKAEKELLENYFTELKDSELYSINTNLKLCNGENNQLYADKDYEGEFDKKEKLFLRFIVNDSQNNKTFALMQQHKRDVLIENNDKKGESIYALLLKHIDDKKSDCGKIRPTFENVFGENKEFMVLEYRTFINLEKIVEDIVKNYCKDRLFLDILYPDVYTLKERELNNILGHKIDSLNLVKFYEKYIPQFPFQRKKSENKNENVNLKGLELWD